jgi:hypothetical protein
MKSTQLKYRSTADVLRALRESNPEATVTEHSIRGVIRRGVVRPPTTLGGAYAWSESEINAPAAALGLVAPK